MLSNPLFAILPFGIGGTEIAICGIVAILLFGKQLPAMARSFGQSFSSFQKGILEGKQELFEMQSSLDRETKEIKESIS